MRLLILNGKKTNDYSSYFLSLLSEILEKRNYTSTVQEKVSDENEIVVKDVPSNVSSFFYSMYLRNFIRKKRIEWLVQFTDTRLFSTTLYMFVVAANSEKLVAKKNLSSLTKIVVASETEKQDLVTKNLISNDNICLIPVSADEAFQPVSWSERQAIKMQYTQGKEYFITYSDGKTNEAYTSLLKAFSSFKKWQHSSMKLVVVGRLYFTQTKEWKEKISSYKYRDDIVLIEDAQSNEKISLLAGAYAFLHTPKSDNDVIPLLQAMQCETPCISFTSGAIQEYADKAALLIEPNNYDQLGDKMILLYKDETLRTQLIEAGKTQAKHYSRDKAQQALADVLPIRIH